ncbi:unnamed protein product [Spirodela intermedia]|uniref:MHD domain-containing protein n=1 Tax=Spirodela intermedia TaxID=51605 RepID=A0A7I8JG84_SPIIN|nr:unnamed protein product [Spirodela intermedia]CAA6668961.1 unnamed protein product [Spirodela intermedia]
MSGYGSCCSIRAIWILNSQDSVVFSRRFPVVEKRWRAACLRQTRIEGSARGFGIRTSQSTRGSDSWVDDPITRHIISLSIDKNMGESFLLWPLVLHIKGYFHIFVLPLVEPRHLKAYERMYQQSDSGSSAGGEESLSSLLLDLPCITGYGGFKFIPICWGLLDSLTGTIGITGLSARAKPVAAPVASTVSGSSATGVASSDAPKSSPRSIDKDALRSFISNSMPFGTPLDLNYSNIAAIRTTGFSSSDILLADLKQPSWKPYLYKGKQRILFTFHEIVHAAMYDRDEIPDIISISGQVNCRAELEGLADVSFPLAGLDTPRVEVLSFHPCAQVPEQGMDKHAIMFTPPLGNFVLMLKGFYQLSMVSENEGAFLFKLRLMEGYKTPLTMEYCTVSLPFPQRRVMFFDGNPSIGTVSTTDHSVEWKIITTGRGITGKSIEATFPGTIGFSPILRQMPSSAFRPLNESLVEDDSDLEQESSSNTVNMEEFLMEKMKRDILPADLEEPFCWQAYNYAKISFKILGGTLSGMMMDPKSVSIYPAIKAPVEYSMQAVSGDYILWNTLGRCPSVALPKV